jgi:hypothetical protein
MILKIEVRRSWREDVREDIFGFFLIFWGLGSFLWGALMGESESETETETEVGVEVVKKTETETEVGVEVVKMEVSVGLLLLLLLNLGKES